MREIKFRVWMPNAKCYADRSMEIENLINPFNGKAVFNFEELGDSDVELEYFDDDSYILEQYTGLKDKNGVEIFEGDIVDSHADWDEPYFRTVIKNPNEPRLEFSPLSGHTLCKNNQHKFLVIGNIHEERT